MVCLWFLILFIAPLYGMDGALSSSALLVKAIRAGEHEKVATLIAAEDLINVEIQGSYPLHWAVLSLLKPVKDPASI